MKSTNLAAAAAIVAASIASTALADQGVVGDDGALQTYTIGNSLTRGLTVGNGATGNRLQQLFDAGGVDYTYGTQLGAGFRLYQHLDQQAGGGSGSFNFNNENSVGAPAFGDYDNAFGNFDFDAAIFQPFQFPVDVEPGPNAMPDRRFVVGDRQAINAFVDYARGLPPQTQNSGRYIPPADTAAGNDGDTRFDLDNPNSNFSTDRFFVYETWPTVDGVYNRTASDRYSDFWTSDYNPDLPTQNTVPNRESFDLLIGLVNGDNPDLDTPVRVIPVGEVLYELDLAIRDGTLPGIEDYYGRPEVAGYYADARDGDGSGTVEPDEFPFQGFDAERGVLNFYADIIHLNDQPHNGADSGTIGAYVAALTHYAVLTGQSPVGLPVGPYDEFLDPTLDADLIEALQQTVFDVVTSDPNTGVVVPEPGAAAAIIGGVGLLSMRRRR